MLDKFWVQIRGD